MPEPESPSTETVIHFPYGLPGFENECCFRLVQQAALAPVLLLQSDRTAGLCFVTIPVETIVPGYELPVSEADYEALHLEDAGNVLGLAIVTVPESGPATANLMAPLLVHTAEGIGVQIVRSDQLYSHQHPLGDAPCL